MSKSSIILRSVLMGLGLWAFAIAIYHLSPEDSLAQRIGILMGGDVLGGGYIQFATYVAFFWCLLDIHQQTRFLQSERKAIDRNELLPDREQETFRVLTPQDVNNIRMKVIQSQTREKSLFFDVIKKSTTKFRTNQSISEMLDVISSQMRIYQANAEGGQSIIRYLAWVIPSIGFIGTVLGISQALGIADSADTKLVTRTLGLAFDTTLVALLLSIIVMWYYHNLQQETDEYHAYLEDYVIDNLVNRIET